MIYIVSTLEDELDATPGDGDGLSLREAVALANMSAGADVIRFDVAGFIRLSRGEIAITDEVSIEGDGVITISGDAAGNDVTDGGGVTDIHATALENLDDNSRIFDVAAHEGETVLSGLAITGGRTQGLQDFDRSTGRSIENLSGGGLRTEASLTLEDVLVAGNSTAARAGQGGGVFAIGDIEVVVRDSEIRGNAVAFGAGNDGGGGGVALSGGADLLMERSSVIENEVRGAEGGGGVFLDHGSEATIRTSTISDNKTSGGTGGGVTSRSNLTIEDSWVENNSVGVGSGGGVANLGGDLRIVRSSVSDNAVVTALYGGGGVFAESNIHISGSNVSGNRVFGSVAFDDGAGGGVAVFQFGSRLLETVIESTSITGNTASSGGGVANFASRLTVSNSTIADNAASGSLGTGGGVALNGAGEFQNVTITGNTTTGALAAGPAIHGLSDPDVTIRDSIVFGNVASDGRAPKDEILLEERIEGRRVDPVFLGVNFLRDVSPDTPGVRFEDPRSFFAATREIDGVVAGVLSEEGGRGPSVALLASASNPALDVGSASGVDGRGLDRAVDLAGVPGAGLSDIGAFELQVEPAPAPRFLGGTALEAVENLTDVGVVAAIDAFGGARPSLTLLPGDDGVFFNLDAETGALRFKSAPNFEGPKDADDDNVYDIRIKATSEDGASATRAYFVLVQDEGPTDGRDQLFGSDGDDVINGRGGPDRIRGFGGDDTLIGGAGSDFIVGGDGFDVIRGRGGADTLKGQGDGARIEGNAGADVIFGGDFGTVFGGGGRDLIFAGAGLSTAFGGNGGDTITGSDFANRLQGGRGDDELRGRDANDDISGDAGDDRIFGGKGRDSLDGGVGDDMIWGGAGHDSLGGFGGNDRLFGRVGDDDISGGLGADVLFGGADDDRLAGGEGADRLLGGAGDDSLRGEGGADVFVFSEGGGSDLVFDFQPGVDLIEIRGGAIEFDDLLIVVDGLTAFIGFDGTIVTVRLPEEARLEETDFLFGA